MYSAVIITAGKQRVHEQAGLQFRGCKQSVFLVILCMLLPAMVVAQKDSVKGKAKEPEQYGHQLRLSLDLSKPVINLTQHTRKSYEAAVDYYLKNEVYVVAEAGFGNADYDYTDLSYNSRSAFFRVGIDKTLLKRIANSDWDAVFMGLRYGASFINRQEATYTIVDSVWGSSTGIIPAKSFTAQWMEVTAGVKVEVLKNLMLGWNIRGRFLLNERAFRDLSPVFIAGYGKGDKSTIFDFSFFLSYAIRWGAGNVKARR